MSASAESYAQALIYGYSKGRRHSAERVFSCWSGRDTHLTLWLWRYKHKIIALNFAAPDLGARFLLLRDCGMPESPVFKRLNLLLDKYKLGELRPAAKKEHVFISGSSPETGLPAEPRPWRGQMLFRIVIAAPPRRRTIGQRLKEINIGKKLEREPY